MKRWTEAEKYGMMAKRHISVEYVQYLIDLGRNCSDKESAREIIEKHGNTNSVYCAVFGGYHLAQGRWTVDFTTEKKTWQRFGDINYDGYTADFIPSRNHRDDHAELGVSVIDDGWKASIGRVYAVGSVYEMRGLQVGWGSDDEPVIIPTSFTTKVKKQRKAKPSTLNSAAKK